MKEVISNINNVGGLSAQLKFISDLFYEVDRQFKERQAKHEIFKAERKKQIQELRQFYIANMV